MRFKWSINSGMDELGTVTYSSAVNVMLSWIIMQTDGCNKTVYVLPDPISDVSQNEHSIAAY